jgi:hypothetical protein
VKKEVDMRRVIFNLSLLLLLVVLVAALGAPGATASIAPVTSPSVSQVTAEASIAGRSAASNALQAGTLFDVWPWPGSATSAATMSRPDGDVGRSRHGSTF